jgi:hypothetical protein
MYKKINLGNLRDKSITWKHKLINLVAEHQKITFYLFRIRSKQQAVISDYIQYILIGGCSMYTIASLGEKDFKYSGMWAQTDLDSYRKDNRRLPKKDT